jgi:hypothetical protein
VSDKAAEILSSKLILNLNEPSRNSDTSFIKPQKFVGVWWAMHVEKSTWNYSDTDSVSLAGTGMGGRVLDGRRRTVGHRGSDPARNRDGEGHGLSVR